MPSRRPLFSIVVAVLLAISAACVGPGPGATPGAGGTASPDAAPGRAVTFTSADEIMLSGRIFGDGHVGVVLAHMFPADASSWYETAERLAEAGYVALAFDFRGYGDSEGSRDPSMAAHDVRAAYDYLHRSGAEDIALVGASMGGTASLIAAASAEVRAVVTVSAPARFGDLDAIQAADRIEVPVLLMSAQSDEPGFESLQWLARRLADTETALFEGDAHGTNLLTDRPEALEHIVGFLTEHAPPNDGG